MIIGFGSTEQAFEKAEQEAITQYVERRFADGCPEYFSEAFVSPIRQWLNERAKEFHAKAEGYRTATDYPERYSRYWPAVIADANHIVFILTMHHINRRHAMSPDGWAMMKTEPVFVIKHLDLCDLVADAETDA